MATPVNWDVVLAAMHAWVVGGSGLSDQKVVYGQQDAPRPEFPAITMRIANITELGSSWLDYAHVPLVFSALAVTAVDVAANTLTCALHARVTGDGPVRVASTGTVPPALTVNTDYWVVRVDANTIKLATSFANAMAAVPVVVDLTGAGTGSITIVATSSTVRAGQEMEAISRTLLRVTLELHCHGEPIVGNTMAVALLQRVRGRRELPSQQAILEAANLALQDVERVRAIIGTRDDFLFEPRAYLDVHMNLAVEESEAVTIIERVTGTNQIADPDQPFAVP